MRYFSSYEVERLHVTWYKNMMDLDFKSSSDLTDGTDCNA